MKAHSNTVTEYVLTLSKFEALWLRGYLQNKLTLTDEDESDAQMRETFFNLLKETISPRSVEETTDAR